MEATHILVSLTLPGRARNYRRDTVASRNRSAMIPWERNLQQPWLWLQTWAEIRLRSPQTQWRLPEPSVQLDRVRIPERSHEPERPKPASGERQKHGSARGHTEH